MPTIAYPALPDTLKAQIGQAAHERLEILERKRTELEIRGDLRPCTIYNISPFDLSLASGLIPFKVPRAPGPESGKPKFSAHVITTIRSYPIYLGNREMSDRSIKAKWDVNVLTPLMQGMEFKHYYMGESEEDVGVRQGGVVVIDGLPDDLVPESEVRIPTFMFRKNNRYIVLHTRKLRDAMREADEMMHLKCSAVLDQANIWFDDEDTRKNIQNPERVWHDYALARQWITGALPWRTAQTRPEDRCLRCSDAFVSKTGVCKCSYVKDPFVAFMSGEIMIDHVRMNIITKDQWAKVKAEQQRRDEARA